MVLNKGPHKACTQYSESTVFTSDPEELTLMLYNGLVEFIIQAHCDMEADKMNSANNNILRAEDILTEFVSTLDRKYEISQSLLLLYDYMYRRLIDADTKKDKDILEEVLGFAKELRDTWAQAMKLAKQPQVRPQPQAAAK